MKVLVLFYSAYGHTWQLAEAAAKGALSIDGIEVDIKQVPETLPEELRKNLGIAHAQQAFSHIPIANPREIGEYDAIIFGTPTRFGMMASQMKAFLDGTGALWSKGELTGKIGSVFTSTSTQHGGQEATVLSFHTVLLHHGMMIVGLPYAFEGQSQMNEIAGGSPYGASTITGPNGQRQPSQIDLDGAFYQGKHVATMLSRMK